MKPYEKMNKLLDFYECLLTAKQQEIMNYYYRDDYSLSEIAENLKITRSAVQDNIKRASHSLETYETKLKLSKKYHHRLTLYEKLNLMDDSKIKEIYKQLLESEDEV
ncbi:putative DNA-binding protein YlxM (UPF0122 family) [Breznakia sp. PF5-3]|uniref:YlxM family DNA-binding protein n=1 Tax=unclassified Breznakia TaxID=2623764 RepID=UPI0024067E6E|nr:MULTISPECIES: sigma factor-like helix-turn-helix DNA-binding protein [unclassified Breznakia]MDL2276141.1 DNA-binding protein [Breznakia sp. OttesenSCG-928-G09]MDF9824411.1 putative DNA-binding protein YlxM (UPF0122 family) [Breznakia sp. PM6-1]MDF9835140.1 putative DNA-binding protein YlxM (UPF0122 family) [Breznakia sp. PF5-3]MDF9838212.1 putative DNA-binding protein YlxM (UPF0122 family) [Breznakia sp. PFB2-8]MDF9860227.1 putative DNA-binding protein YlxM (UPF0122 family) [Breznakia sp. 